MAERNQPFARNGARGFFAQGVPRGALIMQASGLAPPLGKLMSLFRPYYRNSVTACVISELVAFKLLGL
jgi:hypothetical protein